MSSEHSLPTNEAEGRWFDAGHRVATREIVEWMRLQCDCIPFNRSECAHELADGILEGAPWNE